MTDDQDGEWLTWAEAADRLGIKLDSVKRRARSRKWPRRTGNDNLARVLIPTGRLDTITPDDREEGREVILPPTSPDTSMLERAIRAETRAEAAEKILDEIRADRDEWRSMAQRLTNRNDQAGFWARIFRR